MPETKDGTVVSLAEIKVNKTGDCRNRTPVDALKALIREIEAGEIIPVSMACCMWIKDSEDRNMLFMRNAGLNYESATSLLALSQYTIIKEWQE